MGERALSAEGFLLPLLRIRQHFTERATEWLVAGMLITWGYECLTADPAVWNLPINSALRTVAGQKTWGTIALSIGLIRLAALYINGAMRRSPHLRSVGAFLSCFLWLQLTLGVMLSELHSLAFAFYPWLFFADFYNAQRAARDAGFVDWFARAGERTVDATES